MNKGAIFSHDRKYRYVLIRKWNDGDKFIMFVGLNPSTADENKDDPTIRRCIGFAKDFGADGIYMLNLFAYRATDPCDLFEADDPIGDENDFWLKKYAEKIPQIIVMWGGLGKHNDRDKHVASMLGKHTHLMCLKINKDCSPAHPLYLPKTCKPTLWHDKEER